MKLVLQSSPMHAYIPAADLARARKFYEQKLGFKPKAEVAGGVIYEFAGGTSCFMRSRTSWPAASCSRNTTFPA